MRFQLSKEANKVLQHHRESMGKTDKIPDLMWLIFQQEKDKQVDKIISKSDKCCPKRGWGYWNKKG